MSSSNRSHTNSLLLVILIILVSVDIYLRMSDDRNGERRTQIIPQRNHESNNQETKQQAWKEAFRLKGSGSRNTQRVNAPNGTARIIWTAELPDNWGDAVLSVFAIDDNGQPISTVVTTYESGHDTAYIYSKSPFALDIMSGGSWSIIVEVNN